MGLENYFRRQAARSAGLSSNTMKLVRGAMDLIFGFLGAEMKTWLDAALSKDSLCVYGNCYNIPLICLPLAQTDSWNDRLFGKILDRS